MRCTSNLNRCLSNAVIRPQLLAEKPKHITGAFDMGWKCWKGTQTSYVKHKQCRKYRSPHTKHLRGHLSTPRSLWIDGSSSSDLFDIKELVKYLSPYPMPDPVPVSWGLLNGDTFSSLFKAEVTSPYTELGREDVTRGTLFGGNRRIEWKKVWLSRISLEPLLGEAQAVR